MKRIEIRGSYSRFKLGEPVAQDRGQEPAHAEQVRRANLLYLAESPDISDEILRGIRRKHAGYRSQDRKKALSPEGVVSPEAILEKLVVARLRCRHCRGTVKLLYAQPRDLRQWTLDRLDNSQGHTVGNTVVACLGCNLQRGTQDAERFSFGKGLRVRRI
jgi:hypothetical protein